MTPSKDLQGSSGPRGLSARAFIKNTSDYHQFLSELFKVSFPNEYKIYHSAYVKALSCKEDYSQGAWLGRAVLTNVQTLMHADGLDGQDAVCGIVGGGKYLPVLDTKMGVALVLPQLRIALRYFFFFFF